MSISVQNIFKSWGKTAALSQVSLDVQAGELVGLIGPSGSGKTTLLRIIGGLEAPDAGSVLFEGEDATTASIREREVGFVFQHYALFRHMNVYENIAFGLRVLPKSKRPPKAVITKRVQELLELVQLQGLARRLPAHLSGGQRQRVALARALAVEPKVLLLDEPFGALDAKVRQDLRRWLRRLHDDLHVTTLFVTHDQEEALEVADRVVILNKGKIEQYGTPENVLDTPATSFVNEFMGEVNVLKGKIDNGFAHVGPLRLPAAGMVDQDEARAVIRVYDIKLWRSDPGKATVSRMWTLGDRVKVMVDLDGVGPLTAQFPRRSSLLRDVNPGSRVDIEVTLARVYPGAKA